MISRGGVARVRRVPENFLHNNSDQASFAYADLTTLNFTVLVIFISANENSAFKCLKVGNDTTKPKNSERIFKQNIEPSVFRILKTKLGHGFCVPIRLENLLLEFIQKLLYSFSGNIFPTTVRL